MPEEIVRVNEANQKSDRLEKQVATPADFTSPEVLYEDLIQEIRKYHPSSDLSDIERAYIMQAVRQFNQDNTDILCHGKKHFS